MRRLSPSAWGALVAAGALVFTLGCSRGSGHPDDPQQAEPSADAGPIAAHPADSAPRASMHRAEFAVAGMTCGACAAATRIALERLDGVSDAGASYRDGRAWARYDPGRITPERMERAIRKLGYRPTLLAGQQTP